MKPPSPAEGVISTFFRLRLGILLAPLALGALLASEVKTQAQRGGDFEEYNNEAWKYILCNSVYMCVYITYFNVNVYIHEYVCMYTYIYIQNPGLLTLEVLTRKMEG